MTPSPLINLLCASSKCYSIYKFPHDTSKRPFKYFPVPVSNVILTFKCSTTTAGIPRVLPSSCARFKSLLAPRCCRSSDKCSLCINKARIPKISRVYSSEAGRDCCLLTKKVELPFAGFFLTTNKALRKAHRFPGATKVVTFFLKVYKYLIY